MVTYYNKKDLVSFGNAKYKNSKLWNGTKYLKFCQMISRK